MSTKSKAAKNLSQGVAPKSRTVKPLARKANEPVIEQSGTKQSRLIALLQISGDCSIAQMTDLTGWQPHTVRGVISAVLRKRLGLNVVCESSASGNTYKIVATAR